MSPNLRAYQIDAKTGKLTATGQYPLGDDANWIEIVKFNGSNGE